MRLIILLFVSLAILVTFLNPGGMIKWFEADESQVVQQETQSTPKPDRNKPQPDIEKAFKNELAQQVAVVANRYEDAMRFPQYSIPINEGQMDLLEPLQAHPVGLNIDPKATSSAALAADSFINFHGEPLRATLSTTGNITARQVEMSVVFNNEKLAGFSLEASDKEFVGTLKETDPEWPVDLHIRADFLFGEYGKVSILSPIKYSADNGKIQSVGKAYVDTVNLAIPVSLLINQAGRYRLSANLYDQANRPLAHLNAKQNLKAGENTWVLNVHSEVLRAANNAGPYVLKTFQLTKLPERPGVSTSFGKSEVGEVSIDGFPLEHYDATPWQDPKDQARLEFLRKLQSER